MKIIRNILLWLAAIGIIASPALADSTGQAAYVIANQASANQPSIYTGLTFTRQSVPDAFDTTHTWEMARSMHWSRENQASFTVGYPNFYVTTSNVETSPGAAQMRVTAEYPAGTITPCLDTVSNSSALVTIAGLTTGYWVCPVAVPNGAMAFMRVLYVNSAGIIFDGLASGAFNGTYENWIYGTGTPTDQTQSGTISTNFASSGLYRPMIMEAPTRKPAICLVGDSRVEAIKDSVTNIGSDIGEIARTIGPYFAYTNLARASTTAGQMPGNFTARMAAIPACSHLFDELGVNDNVAGSTIATRRTAIAAMFPGKIIFGTTIYGETTSTDSWATTGNQTGISGNSNTNAFNVLARSGAGIPGEVYEIDIQYALDPLNLGVFPVSWNRAATSGTAITTDGIHMLSLGTIMTQDRLQYLPALIKR